MKTERELLDNFKKYHNANYHDGDNTFDSRTYRMTEVGEFESAFVQDCFEHYEAAWEEQQKGIDNVLKTIEWHLEDCACFHPMSKYQLGWFEAMSLIKSELIKYNEKQHSAY